jgi:transposase
MEQFIGCDAHKKFSVFVAVNEKGQAGEAMRVAHDRQLYREFLARLPPHSAIAVEASGSYSWLVDEMERSGHHPRLCNPLEARRRMGLTNQTDKLHARGLAILLRNGTRPEVWIPPSEVRDQRSLASRTGAFLLNVCSASRKDLVDEAIDRWFFLFLAKPLSLQHNGIEIWRLSVS